MSATIRRVRNHDKGFIALRTIVINGKMIIFCSIEGLLVQIGVAGT